MTIAFIGLGNMGLPMALNLQSSGFKIIGYDIVAQARNRAAESGLICAESAIAAAEDAETILTILPAAEHVRDVWLGEDGLLAAARDDALLIDCSTIDVATAQLLHQHAGARAMLDAPVSGGVSGASAGTLAFMIGGSADVVARAQPLFDCMGRVAFHVGAGGHGQAAKICNNMALGATMIATCEAFLLAEKLELDTDKLFAVMAASSAQSWALTTYCPVPGPVPTSPANRDYQAGFSTAMMLKDMILSQQAAAATATPTPMGAAATKLYTALRNDQGGERDFSSIIGLLRDGKIPD